MVQSAVGEDISDVPYFGSLVVPAMALSITSGVITSPALPHLFGEESPLLAYGDTLPAGVTSQFDLDVGKVKGAVAKFYGGVIAFRLPDSIELNIEALASVIPGISGAMEALPPQIQKHSECKDHLILFQFNLKRSECHGFIKYISIGPWFPLNIGGYICI